jgi:hypothetical protein
MMRPGPSAPARASVVGVRQPPAPKLANLTAACALRALEVVVFDEMHRERLASREATLGRAED